MNSLPSSIETALEEAGFSSTEILILRRLMEDDGLSLRQLAAKTGKSTGVLDQSTKKLLRRGIITKEDVNGSPTYILHSIAAISQWMEEDMRQKREMLTRKFQNFEAFLQTLEVDKKRPEMKYFEELDGIAGAYRELLQKGKEIRAFIPVQFLPEEDPLKLLFVEFFRERRKKGIFMRVIAHDTPLGRRYQSRDAFEYRKTVLVSEDAYPFAFEKYIVGDTLACINRKELRACFIKFPEMVENERQFFDLLWEKKTQPKAQLDEAIMGPQESVPISTRTLSALREFFLSPKSLASFVAFAILAAGITYGLYENTKRVNLERVRERVQSIAATAAFQFDTNDLNALRVEKDWQKPEWAKVVNQLKEIRESNPGVLYAYIFRKSKTDPSKLEFVSDSHSLNPYANLDNDPTNDINIGPDDGKFDPYGEELLQWPGQPYDSAPKEAYEAFAGPTSNQDFYTDKWGTVVSGYAPIRDSKGDVTAVIAVDIDAQAFGRLNQNGLNLLPYFLGAFFLFILIRLMAFHRPIANEILVLLKRKKILTTISVISACGFCVTLGLYFYTVHLRTQEIGEKLASLAATAAEQVNPDDLDKLHAAEDMKREEYQRVFRILNNVRGKSKDIKFAYIIRPTDKEPEYWEFVADADSNWNLPQLWKDFNFDGQLNNADENVWPGLAYDIKQSPISPIVLKSRTPNFETAKDQWGNHTSGAAAIVKNETALAILGLDFDRDILLFSHLYLFLPWFCIFGLCLLASAAALMKKEMHGI